MNNEMARLRGENKRLRAALHPGKLECDCIERIEYKGEKFWMCECQCGNYDDCGRAQAWVSKANSYEGATGEQITAHDKPNPAPERRECDHKWSNPGFDEPPVFCLKCFAPKVRIEDIPADAGRNKND